MEYINKLKIGEFGKLCHVTIRTLRHYETIGLLMPAEVDKWTGYRYYHVSQLQQMEAIRRLKESGFSLEEICDMMASESQIPTLEQIEAKIRQTEAMLREMVMRRDRLQAMLNSQIKNMNMEKFSIQSIPAMTVASYRGIIKSYDDLGTLCCNVIGPEMARLGCECPEPGYCYTFEHNKEYRDHDIDIEYCEKVAEAKEDSDIIKFKRIPEVPMALCMKVYGPYSRLYQSYLDLFAYMEKEGYKMIDAPRACYVDGIWNQSDPEKWLTIVQVPVEKTQLIKTHNMNRLKLFCCPVCGGVSLSYNNVKIECCKQLLDPVPVKKADEGDKPMITEMDGEYLLEYSNPMSKDFYIAAVVAERYDRIELIRLFPEQAAQVRLSQIAGAKIYTIYRQNDNVWATMM